MTSQRPSGGATKLPQYAMFAGAISAGIGEGGVTFGLAQPTRPLIAQGATMTPQDQELIFAKVDAKIAGLQTDIKLNTQGFSDLKERFVDLSGKMSSVPADISAMKRDIAHLPSKEYLIKVAAGMLGLIAALITFGDKLQAIVK